MLILNLFVYFIIQPLSFIYLFICLKKKRELAYINNFLKSVSFISFSTLIFYIFSDAFCTGLCPPLYKLFIINFQTISKYGLFFPLMMYSWIISASYFVLYFFNKKNKFGIYLHTLLFFMFVFVLFELAYRYWLIYFS